MDSLKTNPNVCTYIIDSQEEEIKRIAHELHEGVGQNLYSILTGLQFLASGEQDSSKKSYMSEMNLLIEKTIQEIRLLSVELHPPALTTLGLLPAMKSYIRCYTSTFGIIVELESSGEGKLITEKQRIAVFRVCQEALTNIAKYADTAIVKMNFFWKETELKITIRDFGKGFQPEEFQGNEPSSGLAAMKERMLLIGGKCVISSNIGEGTSIEISLPLSN
ncbi:sensor histidine kinase [Bacillus sp. FJAT-29953]|nr:sensor histidine kinase [Bacillus sp. FJAT-29953]